MSQPDSIVRIAFLGADAETPELARAAGSHRGFEIVGAAEIEAAEGLRLGLWPPGRVRMLETWEALLDSTFVDAVVVARGNEDVRAEQLRKFTQTGVPVLASHPLLDSMLVYYELDMIRRETGSLLLPALAERNHPAVEALAALVASGADSPIGKVEQVHVERHVAEPSREVVLASFARDVDVLRRIAGDMTRLGAMAGGSGERAYANLGVQMSGPTGVAARWTVVPAATPGAKIALVGSDGRATVEVASANGPWKIEMMAGDQRRSQTFEAWDPAVATLDQLALAIAGAAVAPTWVDAARSIELADTIDRSLHKGRTIELYYEDHSEEGTFKGLMTSLGCGILVFALGLVVVVSVAEQLGMPNTRFWPYALLGGLALFLVLQLLVLVFQRKPADVASPGETERP